MEGNQIEHGRNGSFLRIFFNNFFFFFFLPLPIECENSNSPSQLRPYFYFIKKKNLIYFFYLNLTRMSIWNFSYSSAISTRNFFGIFCHFFFYPKKLHQNNQFDWNVQKKFHWFFLPIFSREATTETEKFFFFHFFFFIFFFYS